MENLDVPASAVDAADLSRVQLTLEADSGPMRTIESLFIGAFISGEHRFSGHHSIRGDVQIMDLVPDEYLLERRYETAGFSSTIWRSPDGQVALLVDLQEKQASVAITCATRELLSTNLARLASFQIEISDPDEQSVFFWNLNAQGGTTVLERVTPATPWDEVARNYPTTTRTLLGDLVKLERPSDAGRLILWHGAPGTGKTSAVRAVADAWSSWCDLHVVTDPEYLFDSPEYLTEVMFSRQIARPTNETSQARRWKLVVGEDVDDFVTQRGGRHAASLSRLLNLTDGLLGQGSNLLVLLTTNQPIRRLAMAIVRPGRCLAAIEFETFSPAEAREWMGVDIHDLGEPLTLADLYDRRACARQIASTPTKPPIRIGAYL